MLTILIASDHKPFRETLTRLLLAQPGFLLVAVCADTHAAISISTCSQPDIVLLDGSSDPLSAIEATKKIVSCSAANVIALSHDVEQGFATHIMAAGALGYLTKNASGEEIILAVQEVAKDNMYVCNEMNTGVIPPLALLPTPVAERPSFFTQAKEDIACKTEKKVSTAVHWHGILKFTN